MISVRKRVAFDAWNKRKLGRATKGEFGCEIKAEPEDASIPTAFKIVIRKDERTDTYSLTLEGKLPGRIFEGLLRYNVHDSIHANPEWFPPPIIESGDLHRHVYQERAVREGRDWDACAELLKLPSAGSPNQQYERLLGKFMVDANIRVSDSETHTGLYGFRQQP